MAITWKRIYQTGGTDVAVADGGTGASTLTDHGVLLGSGTGAVTPTAVGATGEYLAGATEADAGWATLNQAAVAGLTTASSPTFAGLTLPSGPLSFVGNEPFRSVIHGGVATIHAGNNGLGQSRPPVSKITQSAAIAGTRTSASLFTRTAAIRSGLTIKYVVYRHAINTS